MTYTLINLNFPADPNFGKVQSEGGVMSTGAVAIPGVLGEDSANQFLSFSNPQVVMNLDIIFTGSNPAALKTQLDLWLEAIRAQSTDPTQAESTFTSDLSGPWKATITEFTWAWSFAPSNNMLSCKVTLLLKGL